MRDYECKAYVYRLQGLSTRAIQNRLKAEGVSEADIQKGITNLRNINANALPVPQITIYYEGVLDDKIRWWQDNWLNDQWDDIDESEFNIRRRTALMLNHKIVEGLPED